MAFHASDVLDEGVRQRPDAVALVRDDGSGALTWRDLDARSRLVASALQQAGVGPGVRVAHLDLNAPSFFELLFGALRIGAVLAPLNWRLTADEVGRVIADAEAPVLVVGDRFLPLVEDIRAAAGDALTTVVEGAGGYEAWLQAAPPADLSDTPVPGDGTVLQLYTSGTTGLPKGVRLTHENFATLTTNDTGWGIDPTSVSLVAMPLFHIGGAGWALAGMVRGATSVVVGQVEPAGLLDTLERQGVTHGFLVPAVLAMLAAVPGAAERDLSALRCVVYGASPITSAVLLRSLETLRAPHYQVYGLTETTGAVTQLEATDHDIGGPRAHLLRSAGRPYPWVELRTVDPVSGEPTGPGEVGEVWVRSHQVMAGYWHRPEETAAALVEDGWFRTGDAGYLDPEGFLFLTDRIKDMVVTGGENVYPIEIEDVLSKHPEVADVAVIGVPDQRWGETVKAVVVRTAGSDVGEDELLAYAKERLAGFKRPRSVDFVDELPRNPTGKLLKKVLREPYWADQEGRVIG